MAVLRVRVVRVDRRCLTVHDFINARKKTKTNAFSTRALEYLLATFVQCKKHMDIVTTLNNTPDKRAINHDCPSE